MIKSLVKNYLKCCLFSLILGLMYASPATADVCFLPSGGCQSQMVRTTPTQTPNNDCSRFTRQGYTDFGAAQSDADCQLCNGTYYCKCDGNYKKDGNRCVERCSATDYPLTSKKAAPWRCEACSDPLSNNYGRRYKNCTCPSPYTQIGSSKCVDCQGYNVSANDAATKQNNGYTCSACDNDTNSGKYKCSCASSKEEVTVAGVKKCLDKCGANQVHSSSTGACVCSDSKKEIVNGQCVCKSIYRTYNNTCYEQCESPKVADGANCKCPAEYSHTKANGETCTGTTCDGKYRASDCSTLDECPTKIGAWQNVCNNQDGIFTSSKTNYEIGDIYNGLGNNQHTVRINFGKCGSNSDLYFYCLNKCNKTCADYNMSDTSNGCMSKKETKSNGCANSLTCYSSSCTGNNAGKSCLKANSTYKCVDTTVQCPTGQTKIPNYDYDLMHQAYNSWCSGGCQNENIPGHNKSWRCMTMGALDMTNYLCYACLEPDTPNPDPSGDRAGLKLSCSGKTCHGTWIINDEEGNKAANNYTAYIWVCDQIDGASTDSKYGYYTYDVCSGATPCGFTYKNKILSIGISSKKPQDEGGGSRCTGNPSNTSTSSYVSILK